jgi:hypothetical protein
MTNIHHIFKKFNDYKLLHVKKPKKTKGGFKMKSQRKLMVIGLVLALLAVFSVSNVSAAWIGNTTVVNVSSETTGNFAVRATDGTDTFTFTIDSSTENAKAMLAIVLTAASTGDTLNIQYAPGGVMQRIWLVK